MANGIAWLDDVQAFYRERAAIEKEYAGKLNALSRRFYDKKSRKSVSLTVGDSPSLTPGSLERFVRPVSLPWTVYRGETLAARA